MGHLEYQSVQDLITDMSQSVALQELQLPQLKALERLLFFEFHTCSETHTITMLVRTFDSLHNDCHGGECNAPFT